MHTITNGLGKKSLKKFWSLSTYSPMLFGVLNFDFIVKWLTYFCLADFQNTAHPPRVSTHSLVNFTSFDQCYDLKMK